NGFDFLPLTYSGLVATPVVTTIHGFSSSRIMPVYEHYDATTHYVAISDSGRRLDIAGIVQDHHYFRHHVEPHLDGDQVRYLGPIDSSRRARTLSEAHALLHLIDFDEPFGYSVVEAMASGTPVIAYTRGS